MIGSLIYYGLYPLTQLFIRLSESWWKRHLVLINGRPVCDGGAGYCRRLNEQTVMVDQWCNAGTGVSDTPTHTLRKKIETEGLVEKNSNINVWEVVVEKKREEKIALVNQMDRNTESLVEPEADSLSDWDEIQTAADETQSQEDRLRFAGVCPADEFSCHLGSYKAEPKHAGSETYDLFKSSQKFDACTNRSRFLEPTADGAKENKNNGSKPPVQLTSGLFDSENIHGDELGTGTEVNKGSLVYDLSSMLADNQEKSFTNQTWFQPVPTAWNFPVGFGQLQVVHHPLQFPGLSYYHKYQENAPFEAISRMWEDLCNSSTDCKSPHATCIEPESKFDFTVMSYNILAQDLLEANPELYAHCSENVLAWEKRLQNILKELQIWEPDIVCLQEVQENHYQEQIYPALIEMGYECVYKCRTGKKTDGCALCFNTTRFTLLSLRLLEFQRHECELLDRDNVGIVLLLQPNTKHGEGISFRPVCVANTHLLFNPRRGDVKLAQLAIVLAEIDHMIRRYKVKGHECEVILCGDFNSLPQTPLYQLIVSGQLYYHGLPHWMVSGQEDLSYKIHHRRLYAPLWPNSLGISDNCQYYDVCEHKEIESGKLQYNHDFLRQLRYCPAACMRPPDLELIPGVTDNTPNPEEPQPFPPRHFRNTLCHELNLSSVYNQNISDAERNTVTTLHSHGAAMVDYIFYSERRGHARGCADKKGLTLLARLSLPSEADLWLLNGLPNEIFPSDHLSLLAKFQLC